MKPLFLSFLTIIFLLNASVVWGETVDRRKLVVRNGIVYKNFSDVPYTGKVTGWWAGKIVNGHQIGPWKKYWMNGKLSSEGNYSEGGIKNGLWKFYDVNGYLSHKKTYSTEESLRDKAKSSEGD